VVLPESVEARTVVIIVKVSTPDVEASITNLAIKACIEGKDMFYLNIYWSPNNSQKPSLDTIKVVSATISISN